jgi:hypothetical protein
LSLERFLADVDRWARVRPDVLAVALVGSHARGAAHAGSDIDLVLVVESAEVYLADDAWLHDFGAVVSVADEDYGIVRSRHVRYRDSGVEIEWGITDRRWVTKPIDAGTRGVVRAGMRVLHDPHGLLSALARAVPS